MLIKLPNFRSYKNSFFCCLIFEEFEKRFMDQKFYCLLPRQAWSMRLFDFQNHAPWGTKVFIQMVPKWNEVFLFCFGIDSLLTMITNSFKNLLIQKLGNIFYYFSFSFSALKLILSLKNISKIKMTKTSDTQVHLFHANVNIKRLFTSFKSAFRNESIHE